jgi:hypothetical protein
MSTTDKLLNPPKPFNFHQGLVTACINGNPAKPLALVNQSLCLFRTGTSAQPYALLGLELKGAHSNLLDFDHVQNFGNKCWS